MKLFWWKTLTALQEWSCGICKANLSRLFVFWNLRSSSVFKLCGCSWPKDLKKTIVVVEGEKCLKSIDLCSSYLRPTALFATPRAELISNRFEIKFMAISLVMWVVFLMKFFINIFLIAALIFSAGYYSAPIFLQFKEFELYWGAVFFF